MNDSWTVIRVPRDLEGQLIAVAQHMRIAAEQGQLHYEESERFGLTRATVIARLVQHYQRWRERRQKARVRARMKRARQAAEGG